MFTVRIFTVDGILTTESLYESYDEAVKVFDDSVSNDSEGGLVYQLIDDSHNVLHESIS